MDHVNLGWVAGIIDGEGSVELGKMTMWRRPEVSVASTDKEMIDLLKILCGGSISGRSVRKAGWKRSWVWSISSDRALNLLAKIEPLMMCPKKKDRARLLVYGYKAITGWKPNVEQVCEKIACAIFLNDFTSYCFNP